MFSISILLNAIIIVINEWQFTWWLSY
jgi:hypothetical protein